MAQAAYPVSISAGTSLQMQNEPTTRTGNTTYQVTNVLKRLIDKNKPYTVSVNGADATDQVRSVDFNTGVITFSAQVPAGRVVLITAHYYNTSKLLGANSFELSLSTDVLDSTEFDAGGYRTKVYGITDVSLSLSKFFTLNDDYFKIMLDRKTVFVEISLAQKKDTIKGWFVIESNNLSGDVGGLETSEISLSQKVEPGESFSWVSV